MSKGSEGLPPDTLVETQPLASLSTNYQTERIE